MLKIKRAIVLLLVTMLCACAGLSKKDALAQLMDKWVGRSGDDLVVTNGPPSDVFMLDSGGRVFEYFKSKIVGGNSESGGRTRGKQYVTTGYDQNGNPTGYWVGDDMSGLRQRVHRARDDVCKIQFNVAANNIIQSWSKEGDGCD